MKRSKLIFIGLIMIFMWSGCRSHKEISKETYQPSQPQEKTQVFDNQYDYQKLLIEEAKEWIGTPYIYAKSEKGVGTDCSGFVMAVVDTVLNYKIPRNSAKQAEFCVPLESSDVEAGDLVFFATGKDPDKVSHVGLMVDKENFIHSSTKRGVCLSNMSNRYYTEHFICYGRLPKVDEIRKKKR